MTWDLSMWAFFGGLVGGVLADVAVAAFGFFARRPPPQEREP